MTSIDGFKLDKDAAASRRPGVSMRRLRPHQDLRDEMVRDAFEKCRPMVKDYAECTKDKTITGLFLCRGALKSMQACLAKYENDDEMERRALAAGREWKEEY